MIDRVQPLKLEDTPSGGDETDFFPTAADPNEDYLDTRGLTLQDSSSADTDVRVERKSPSGEMQFVDKVVTTPVTLSDLLAGSGGLTEEEHKALRQLIHFIDDGPAEGFASGAYRETLPAGDPFPTSEVWWSSSAKLHKILELLITRAANKMPTQEQWKIYSASDSLLATVTDAITYVNNVFESTRTRTIA